MKLNRAIARLARRIRRWRSGRVWIGMGVSGKGRPFPFRGGWHRFLCKGRRGVRGAPSFG
ncbi:hypothetical protein GCM10017624_24490 [Azotobacter vinelandii]|nr:hypothetical protein GCM10017624_24490 [Azotobacter vinelandii]